MIIEKRILSITLENDEIDRFKSLIKKMNTTPLGFIKDRPVLDANEIKLIKKLDSKLNVANKNNTNSK